MVREVTIPYSPRTQQKEVHQLLESHRFGVLVTHRRFGKTVLSVNHLIKGALTCARERPRFGLIEPTFKQAKAVAWDYLKHYSDPIPGRQFNESELRADYPNGGQVRLYGADNPDSLRGIYLDGVDLDEFGLMRPNVFSEVVRPTLSDRKGWALFSGTPNGKNQFYDISEYAKSDNEWFFKSFKASETNLLPSEELEAAKRVMTQEEYQQEYECSFEASVKGAIYAQEISQARDGNRIAKVPYEKTIKVHTWWDLGIGDATAIWFVQLVSQEVRLIDYYENSGEGLPHYVKVLQDKGYLYGEHWAPHDIEVREFGSGRSRLEVAQTLGINFRIAPNIALEDGIHAVRVLFPKVFIDSEKCRLGIEAILNYRRDYNQRIGEFKATPIHDWSSHGADALRYLAVSHLPVEDRLPIDRYRRKPAKAGGVWAT